MKPGKSKKLGKRKETKDSKEIAGTSKISTFPQSTYFYPGLIPNTAHDRPLL